MSRPYCEIDLERARSDSRAAAEASHNARIQSVIDDFVAQHERTGYKHCMDYAAVIWAHFAGGSKHPADRLTYPPKGA